MKEISISHLVKGEDLNHHGTLFAGRMAEWFTEACFVAAANAYGNAANVVCIKMHGLRFKAPLNKGDIVVIDAKVVAVGTTSITVYGKCYRINDGVVRVDGYITFGVVDEQGKKMAHNLEAPVPQNEEEIAIFEGAKNLR